ncbi:MAG: UMP kinase [Methanothrix sp.]|nr:UMP kinase [Methanothrix sp.]MCX8207650.1 UMP kinase [Methanothrix sp.]
MIIVYSLGGSVIAAQDSAGLKRYAETLREISRDNQIYVVVGGGALARECIGRAREVGASEALCDSIGILATRMNAALLAAALSGAAPFRVPESYDDALDASKTYRIVVMGGVSPGQTTDAVAAILAEHARANLLVIATSVNGVYTSDPEKDLQAVKIPRMSPKDLARMMSQIELKAGSRSPVDPLAAKIIERSHIPTVVVDGRDVANLIRAMDGTHDGTEIRS